METVSIIMPVYNTDEFLEQAINSVLEQTYKSIELIIINDGSTDNSKEIIERYLKENYNVKLYNFEENRGVGAARNFGITKAKGKYIYFLDSDDYMDSNLLSKLVNHMGEHNLIRGRVRGVNLSTSFAIIFDGLSNVRYFSDKRFNLINKYGVNNFLFKRDYILNNNFLFSDEMKYYADFYFMIPILKQNEIVPYLNEAVYFRRKRNDPLNNPSLNQHSINKKLNNFVDVQKDLKSTYTNEEIYYFLDNYFLNYYRLDIIKHFEESNYVEEDLFRNLSDIMNLVEQKTINEYDWVLKNEVKAICSGKYKKFRRVFNRHHFLRDVKKVMTSKQQKSFFIYKWLFLKLPMKNNLIFFESFLGKSYSDSPKYIYEYLINNQNKYKYKYVWSFENSKVIPGKSKQVKRFSLKYYYYLARAKYWVSNSRLPHYLIKRKNNIYLQTWHGTPLKQLVFDMNEIFSADPNYKSKFYDQSRRWDYLNSPNSYSTNIFRRAFKYEKPMLEFGYPRNDILYKNNDLENINALKMSLGLPMDKKIILYAPTWRDDEFFSRGKYRFELNLNLNEIRESLADDYILILRLHYFIANKIDLSEFQDFVYDYSNYNDIAELYLISDVLITDYSSVFFDYANLKRPILFYMYDIEKYRDKLRGFYLDIESEVPGPILKTTDEIIDSIKNIENLNKLYSDKYDVFYNKFCKWDDGNASKKTVETIFKQS